MTDEPYKDPWLVATGGRAALATPADPRSETLSEPRTEHGRYVLTTGRLHVWPAFDENDVTQIEDEARQQAIDETDGLRAAAQAVLDDLDTQTSVVGGTVARERLRAALAAAPRSET